MFNLFKYLSLLGVIQGDFTCHVPCLQSYSGETIKIWAVDSNNSYNKIQKGKLAWKMLERCQK